MTIKILRNVSVAEFFMKNKQFLGYVNPQRSLYTVVKEFLDNAIDIVEETNHINPTVKLQIERINSDVYKVICEDNGSGIKEEDIPYVFCKFLYTHKFLEKKQSRGQQGIGCTGAVLYAQQSTGKPIKVISKTSDSEYGFEYKLMIDVKRNEPVIVSKKKINKEKTGTIVEVTVKGKYSDKIDEYVKRSILVNPHITFIFNGRVYKSSERLHFNVKPIPITPSDLDYLEFKDLITSTNRISLASFLYNTFKGLGWIRCKEIEKLVGKSIISELNEEDIRNIYLTLKNYKLRLKRSEVNACVYGFGEKVIYNYLKRFNPEKIFIKITEPELYENEVYLIEVGCAYGVGSGIDVHRFSNRMPLLYTPGSCVMNKVVNEVDWRYYKVKKGMIFLIHIASTNVPYSEQSKEAVSDIEFIKNKIKYCLRYIGREIKKWENYKEKYYYIKKLEEDYKKLGELLKE